MKPNRWLLFVFILNLSAILHAQTPTANFQRISLEAGLSSSSVNSIVQDQKGFLWLGTNEGLNKYDGYGVTVFKHDPDDSLSLSHNGIIRLYADRAGILWVCTRGGLNRFDPVREIFIRYELDPANPQSLSHNYVKSICQDDEGMFWIGTSAGLNRFDPARETFTLFQQAPDSTQSLRLNNIISICQDGTGNLWLGTQGGLSYFDRSSEVFTRHQRHTANGENASFANVTTVFRDRLGVLWVGTLGGGLSKMNRHEGGQASFVHYQHDPNNSRSLSGNLVRAIYEDKSGVLWVGTQDHGLNQFDKASETFVSWQNESANPRSLSDNRIEAIFEDRSGELFVATGGGGLNRLDRSHQAFTHYRHQPGNPNSLLDDNIYSLYEDRAGRLWIAGYGGLSRLDRQRKIFKHYLNIPGSTLRLKEHGLRLFQEDQSGMLWLSSFDGLIGFDADREAFVHYQHDPADPRSLNSNFISNMYEDKSGTVWVATGGGLSRLNRAAGTFEVYEHNPDDPESLSGNYAWPMIEDRSGEFWVGTLYSGLNRFDRARGKSIWFQHKPDDPTSLGNNSVWAMYEDPSSVLWLATYGGLNRFDRARQKFTRYRDKGGLSDDLAWDILQDEQGFIWLLTARGLAKFDPEKETFKDYYVSEEFQTSKLNAFCKSRSGEIVVGGMNGMVIFDPTLIKDNPFKPPVVITDFQIFNKSVPILKEDLTKNRSDSLFLYKHISETEAITLSYKQGVFSFEFAALHYALPERNQYAYMLAGFENDWNYVGTRRMATYTNLDPGEYVFRVKGSNNDGLWNEEGASLKIIITPPWWQTWWAYTLSGGIIWGILFALRRYELNRQQWKHGMELERVESEKLKELDSLKSRFFANISHEFRTPLTLILGPLENLRSGRLKDDPDKQYGMMQRNAHRLLRLINQLLDLSKLEAGKLTLEASYGNLVPFVKGLVYSFESLARHKEIALHFESDPNEIMGYFDRDKLEKIITNLLSNAFKFTPGGGEIIVVVSIADRGVQLNAATITTEFVQITISDTGSGIPSKKMPHIFERFYQADNSYVKDQQGSGIGLTLTKELVELHKGEIRVSSEIDKGTEFVICLPLGKDHLKQEEILESSASVELHRGAPLSYLEELSESEAITDASSTLSSPSEEIRNGEEVNIILVVEDNSDMLAYINEQLSDAYQIIEAEDGQEGLKKSIDQIPDLIISDVMMPKMDGYQLCEKIKTEECTSHIPVILLTAKSSGDSKVEGLQLGADDYLIKPFDSQELRVRVKNLIEQRQKLRQRFGKEIKLQPKDIAITSADEKFLQRALELIDQHISDEVFTVEQFGREIGLSRAQLHRKLKGLTDHAPVEFIRIIRLKRAAQLLEQDYGTVAEIAYEVGFSDPSYFTRCFRRQFGILPSEYALKAQPDKYRIPNPPENNA